MARRDSLVEEVLRSGLGSVLRNHGFRKSRHTFRRTIGDSLQITGIQGDRFNLPGNESFTMNLGVHFPQVDLVTGQERSREPCAEDAVVNIRIGSLMDKRADKWWEISSGSDAGKTADSAAQAWKAYALPWFTQCETVVGAQKFAAEQNLYAAAFLLALVAGDRPEAERWLAVITASSGGMARDWYRSIAAKQGLSV